MNRKYELTYDSFNRGLYEIRALRDFSDVKAGDLGGYIESEYNLSHQGDCWIYDEARVFGNARIYGDAHLHGDVMVFEDSKVYGNAAIFNDVRIYGNAQVFGNAHVSGDARIFIYGKTQICGDTWIYLDKWIRLSKDIKLDHGIWTQRIELDCKHYLISSTLERIFTGYYEEKM